LISGGSEQVLVQWQLDTGKKDFLPHLSADVENVAISPRGASYAVHLDNNSAMVLSTADLKPTTYVAGLQSFAEGTTSAKDSLVNRVDQVLQPTPSALVAAINPLKSSHVFLCCGSGQHTSENTTPWVQTFDLDTFRSVSQQAIARSNPTELNINSQGQLGSEPTVGHMSFSSDGRWLVTVDEWQPHARDYDSIADEDISIRDLVSERREVFLKFWSVDAESGSLSLISRVNQPHLGDKPQPVLDLASDPSSTRFATLGADGLVRIWDSRRKIMTASGRDEKAYVSSTWTCSQDIYIGQNPESLEVSMLAPFHVELTRQGALTFSEDGSTLFAALSGDGVAEIHVIDTGSGDVRSVLPDIFSGELKALEIIGSSLIVLADELTVYDVVADELIYSIHLQKLSSQWAPLTQIAVDRRSDTFAVSMPRLAKRENSSSEALHASEIAVFSPQRPEPLLVQRFPRVLTGLLQSGRGHGFIAIDTAAQIWSIQHASDPSSLARPLAELGLNGAFVEKTDEAQAPLSLTNGEDAMSVDDEAEAMESEQEEEEEPRAHAVVIAPQRLTEIFDAGPAFALPPMEEMFYQVTKLLIA
jgi:NET1-associated nuclear protein 1 (U3 small nucleolar RNA-associated protein 17)